MQLHIACEILYKNHEKNMWQILNFVESLLKKGLLFLWMCVYVNVHVHVGARRGQKTMYDNVRSGAGANR